MTSAGLPNPACAPSTLVPPYSSTWAIFLDIDGTLLDLADHPQAVVVEPALLLLLEALRQSVGGAVALVSGRSIADVRSLFAPLAFAVAGQHGAELAGPRTEHRLSISDRQAASSGGLRSAAAELRTLANRHPGMVIEDKGFSIAIHYRLDPSLARCARHAARVVQRRLGADFEIQEGKYVVEVKPSGRNKGSAITELLGHPPFAQRVPLFLGDDITDEYAFEVVNRMGGNSVKVGPGQSQAKWRLPDARAVRDWLQGYVDWRREAGEPPVEA
jgi:trehalose 6-phosphate phosphatase